MHFSNILTVTLLSIALVACSGIEIESSDAEPFAAGHYHYYRWRTGPLPPGIVSNDPIYAIDPVVRREVDSTLSSKGYMLDPARAQFTVDYRFGPGLLQGETSDLASNISHLPSVTPNRQVDQASVDNAIALGGVKETNNLVLQFNDSTTNLAVWQVTVSKIVENANRSETLEIDKTLSKYIARALESLPPAVRSQSP
ncbi:MAG: DUF4136 domain-containing protein [Halioglobus sp.]|nr:DUF4136 domain-containing protein [Halioglobus sp.]